MPSLVQDVAAVAAPTVNVANSSPPRSNKTPPKKSSTVKKPKSKVTPGSETKEPENDGRPVKKQATLMSFFGAASKKPTSAASVKPAVKGSKQRASNKDPKKRASPRTLSPKRTPTSTSTTSLAMVTSSKPDAVGVDKESLREIVLGAVLSPHLKQTPVLVDYERHKGSPMPTNLSVPTLRNTRERLLDRLNSSESPRREPRRLALAQPRTQPSSKPSAEPTRKLTEVPLSSEGNNDEEKDESPKLQGAHDDKNNATSVQEQEDEKTVCFSQASNSGDFEQPVDEVMMQTSPEEASKGDGIEEDVMMQTETIEETTGGNIILVDMTQMKGEGPIDGNNKEDSDKEDDDDMDIEVIPETLVEMTQADSNTEPALHQTQAESNMELDVESSEDSVRESSESSGKQSNQAEAINHVTDTTVEEKAAEVELVGVKSSAESSTKTPAAAKSAPKKSASRKAPQPAQPVKMTTCPERLKKLEENEIMRAKAKRRLSTLSERATERLEEENFEMPEPSTIEADKFGEELSQQAVIKLAVIVQESDLPLSAISRKALDQLKTSFEEISLEIVSEKIKTYFTRENYLACSPTELKKLDKLEDTSNRMWRWELVSLDLLPDDMAAKVKKAQTARRKIRNHSRAFVSLLRALEDADKTLSDASSKKEQCDKLMSRVASLQENVLKYERAAEKARLVHEAKQKKEEAKREKMLEKQKEKELEIATKKEELQRKKEEASKKKDEEKLKKQQEEEKKKQDEERSKKAALKKNKAFMLSFFGTKPATAPQPKVAPVQPVLISSDESAKFWEQINSSDTHVDIGKLFGDLSARSSRRSRTKKVPVPVYVTTSVPTNGFNDERVYAELKTVYFPNKYKFLSFFEDHRPPYHGTWSKRSKFISGKTPFRQDKEQLDYDEDSEAEWEEGDDEFGEDLQDEAADGEEENMDPEEGDTRAYNFQDGWLAEDDDVVYENEEVDDETKMLRKKANSSEMELREEIVAPFTGGVPLVDNIMGEANIDLKNFVHVNGEGKDDLMQPLKLALLTSEAVILCDDDVCIDAYPPNIVDENFVGDPSAIAPSGNTQKSSTNQEMSNEDMKIFAEFVHHSTFPSKDRLVEELRTKHPKVTSSRAQATRKLDVVASKRKNPVGGVIWEVKRKILEELGLEKQLAMSIPEPEPKKEEPKKVKAQKPKPKKSATKVAKASVDNTELSDTAKVEKPASSKKRKKPVVDAAAAALFAQFLSKKSKPS